VIFNINIANEVSKLLSEYSRYIEDTGLSMDICKSYIAQLSNYFYSDIDYIICKIGFNAGAINPISVQYSMKADYNS